MIVRQCQTPLLGSNRHMRRMPEIVGDRCQQRIQLERLQDEVVGWKLSCARSFFTRRGNGNDWDITSHRVGFQLPGRSYSVEYREHQIHYDQVGLNCSRGVDSRAPVCDASNLESFLGQELTEDGPNGRIIFDEQDANHVSSYPPHRLSGAATWYIPDSVPPSFVQLRRSRSDLGCCLSYGA